MTGNRSKHPSLKNTKIIAELENQKIKSFKMVAKPNETLEEYVEHFQYNLQRYPYENLPDNVLKTTMIKGIKAQWVDTLNIMGKGDIYQEY